MPLTGTDSRAVLPFLYHQLSDVPERPWVGALSGTPVESDQPSEKHSGVSSVYPLREWIGPRRAQSLKSLTFEILNKKYEATLRVEVDELLYDKTAQVERRIMDLRRRWAQHWNRQGSALIKLGESAVCYDGQFFFATDHAEGDSGTQSNKVTVSGLSSATAPTATDAETVLWKGVETLLSLRDDTGEPVQDDAEEFVLQVPPSLLKAYAGALKAEHLVEGNGTRSNILIAYGGLKFDLVCNPYLATALGAAAWTTKVAMFVKDGRSLIRQEVLPLSIGGKAEGSEFEFDNDAHEYGIKTIRGFGYGAWQSALMLIQST